MDWIGWDLFLDIYVCKKITADYIIILANFYHIFYWKTTTQKTWLKFGMCTSWRGVACECVHLCVVCSDNMHWGVTYTWENLLLCTFCGGGGVMASSWTCQFTFYPGGWEGNKRPAGQVKTSKCFRQDWWHLPWSHETEAHQVLCWKLINFEL